jgi:hypothetical protein
MVHRWASPALGLVACIVFVSTASSQATDRRAEGAHRRGLLGQNQPNPFTHFTTIPFTVGDGACASGTESHAVTLRIYNILSQVVAIAVLADSTNADQSMPASNARELSNFTLPCGDFVARWDGRLAKNDRVAAPGVYMYQLMIDGRPTGMRKMLRRAEETR